MSTNRFMHPRNLYRTPPDFKGLAAKYPEFKKYAITVSVVTGVCPFFLGRRCNWPFFFQFFFFFQSQGFERKDFFRFQKPGSSQAVDDHLTEEGFRFGRLPAARQAHTDHTAAAQLFTMDRGPIQLKL